ncbi:hypothetical protein IQ07DRAFT_677187 [Pyrenochaeta sp. DS3sAY3a]|nr:hypothetical protein IQ07DRAFT_677187 [Pyrenochaeta sp. DS3sAY3a]
MAPIQFSFALTVLLLGFTRPTLADFDREVDAVVEILHGIQQELAWPFCADLCQYHPITKTLTYTEPAYTITTTLPAPYCTPEYPVYKPSQNDYKPTPIGYVAPNVLTFTSTTTITYHTTSTIYVAPTKPVQEYEAPKVYGKRGDGIPLNRATWCSDYDVPCRLVQYSDKVIYKGCEKYISKDQEVKKVITTEYLPKVTVTSTPYGCQSTEYPTYDQKDAKEPTYKEKEAPYEPKEPSYAPKEKEYEEKKPDYDHGYPEDHHEPEKHHEEDFDKGPRPDFDFEDGKDYDNDEPKYSEDHKDLHDKPEKWEGPDHHEDYGFEYEDGSDVPYLKREVDAEPNAPPPEPKTFFANSLAAPDGDVPNVVAETTGLDDFDDLDGLDDEDLLDIDVPDLPDGEGLPEFTLPDFDVSDAETDPGSPSPSSSNSDSGPGAAALDSSTSPSSPKDSHPRPGRPDRPNRPPPHDTPKRPRPRPDGPNIIYPHKPSPHNPQRPPNWVPANVDIDTSKYAKKPIGASQGRPTFSDPSEFPEGWDLQEEDGKGWERM